MKKEYDLYMEMGSGNKKFNYYFDKITGFFIKNKRHKIKNPKKILILRNDHIGDMVYYIPTIRELKKAFPKTKIVVLASSGNKELIKKEKCVDKIIEIDLFWRRGFKGFLDYFKVLKKIKKEKFDVGIDLRRSKLNILFFLAIPRIKTRIGFHNANGGKAFLTHPILCYTEMILGKKGLKLINEAFGINSKNYWPKITVDKEDYKDVKKLLKKYKIKKYVVFAPGATAESKRWPSIKFNELIKIFHKKYPEYKIILSGANCDRKLIKKLCDSNKEACIPLINFNLRKMSIVFKNAGAVVANDGAGTDVSWPNGGKLISLVGPVSIEEDADRPLGKVKFISHKLPCYPCNWSKPCKKPYGKWCMDLITVDEVMEGIDGFMEGR